MYTIHSIIHSIFRRLFSIFMHRMVLSNSLVLYIFKDIFLGGGNLLLHDIVAQNQNYEHCQSFCLLLNFPIVQNFWTLEVFKKFKQFNRLYLDISLCTDNKEGYTIYIQTIQNTPLYNLMHIKAEKSE